MGTVFYRPLQEQGRPIALPLLMGVYCEDKQDGASAAAHSDRPTGNSSLLVIVLDKPVAPTAKQLLS